MQMHLNGRENMRRLNTNKTKKKLIELGSWTNNNKIKAKESEKREKKAKMNEMKM